LADGRSAKTGYSSTREIHKQISVRDWQVTVDWGMTDFSSELFVASLAIIGVVVIISALLSGLFKRGGGSVFSHHNSSGDA
jgi:hypothetical protein